MRRSIVLVLVFVGSSLVAAAWMYARASNPPPEPLRVNVQWVGEVDDAARVQLERRFGLTAGEARGEQTWSYEIVDISRRNLRALVLDPNVDDTHGIDRSEFSLPAWPVPSLGAVILRAQFVAVAVTVLVAFSLWGGLLGRVRHALRAGRLAVGSVGALIAKALYGKLTVARIAASTLVLTAIAWLALYSVVPGPPPAPVNVRWQANLAEGERIRLERELSLERGKLREGTTWAYGLRDSSRSNIRALVEHPEVEDTHGIDRSRFRVTEAEGRDHQRSTLLLALALGLAWAGIWELLRRILPALDLRARARTVLRTLATPPGTMSAGNAKGGREPIGQVSAWRHLAVVGGYGVFYLWLFGPILFGDVLAAHSDLYEYFLPVFKSPLTFWSNYEFSGFPAFADPQNATWYPPHFFFARVIGSWSSYIASAYLLASVFTYAYVFTVTGSVFAAAVAGLAFGTCEAMMARMVHLQIVHCLPWLPALMLFVEKIAVGPSRRWIAFGAVATACCVLSGHIQIVVYTLYLVGAYALICGWRGRRDSRYWASLTAAFGLGGLLSAVQVLPLLEVKPLLARQGVNFGAFNGFAVAVKELLAFVFPMILHEGREVPMYVGLGILLFAAVGVSGLFGQWRVAFWTVTALLGAGLALGESPLTRAAFWVPLYSSFRVVGRHLIFTTFGLIVVAAFGLAAIRRETDRRRVGLASAILLTMVAVGLPYLLTTGDLELDTYARYLLDPQIGYHSTLWTQAIVAVATVCAAVFLVARPRSVLAASAFVLVVTIDLLGALQEPVAASGYRVPTMVGPEVLERSVHTENLRLRLEPTGQRAIALEGSPKDALFPGTFARLWRVPSAGGYGPMLLGAYSDVAVVEPNGSTRNTVLHPDDRGLDLAAIRTLVVRAERAGPAETFARAGVEWSTSRLGLQVGYPECGHEQPGELSLYPKAGGISRRVMLAGYLRCSEDLEQGQRIGELRLVGADGIALSFPIRAGMEMSERDHGNMDLEGRVRHELATVFSEEHGSRGSEYEFLASFELDEGVDIQRIDVLTDSIYGWLHVDYLTLVGEDGVALPQHPIPLLLNDRSRWSLGERVRTSRLSDRGVDDEARGEEEYLLYDNQRAMPRAWLVNQVVPLQRREMMNAVRYSRLPDGSVFDPLSTALVGEAAPPPSASFEPGEDSVAIQEIVDGRLTLGVASVGGGFLVLADAWYPGWRAEIDGQPTPLYRTNVAFRGVVVPAGEHTVEFLLESWSLRVGAALSFVAVILVAGIAAGRIRPPFTTP